MDQSLFTKAQSLFTKTEIDLLLQRAQAGQPAVEASESTPKVEPFDFLAAGQLSSGQVEHLLSLHAGFAHQLGGSLSNLLGADCLAAPAGAEQIPYGEFATQTGDGVCFGILHAQAPEARVLLHADLAMVLPMIDLMLGGAGAAPETTRSLTEIEQEIFKPVVGLFGSELQAVWARLVETSLRLEHFGTAVNVFPVSERVLLVKFEIKIGEMSAIWTLVLPSLVSNALTRKVEEDKSRAADDQSVQNQRLLRERLLDSRFKLELFLPPSTISVRKLAHLKVGQVIVLKPRSTDPIHFNIAGIKLFQASPVSCGTRRGAQIKRALLLVKNEEKEAG
jgi:flagellar motor switch protein FliM